MNVIVEIEGRDAIPLRAIPLLTDWTRMSPDELVAALAGDLAHHWHFKGLTAHIIENDSMRAIPESWWKSHMQLGLRALSDRIRHTQISDDSGYQEWRRQSLEALPPGAFVWKDEYEPMYYRSVGPRSKICADMAEYAGLPEYVKLQFDPFIADPTIAGLALEGFDPDVASSPKPEPDSTNGTAARSPANDKADWKELAVTQAVEIIERQRKLDLYPNQEAIADEVAAKFRLDGVMGAGGKPLSGAYIKRPSQTGFNRFGPGQIGQQNPGQVLPRWRPVFMRAAARLQPFQGTRCPENAMPIPSPCRWVERCQAWQTKPLPSSPRWNSSPAPQ